MTHYDRPTSLVHCGQFRVLTYEAGAFIPQRPDYGGSASQREDNKPDCRSPLVLGILAATFILTVILLGAAAAQADPVNVDNQAALIRFSNGVSFGAVQRAQTRVDAQFALTRLATFMTRNRLKSQRRFGVVSSTPAPN